MYDEKLRTTIKQANSSESIEECSAVTMKGATYKKGLFLVAHQTSYQYKIKIGKICMLLLDNKENIYFLLEIIDTSFTPHLRIYELGNTISYECFPLHKVVDFKGGDTTRTLKKSKFFFCSNVWPRNSRLISTNIHDP